MNALPNIATMLATAEAAKDAATWEALARALLVAAAAPPVAAAPKLVRNSRPKKGDAFQHVDYGTCTFLRRTKDGTIWVRLADGTEGTCTAHSLTSPTQGTADHTRYLTNPERIAQGLPPLKEGKYAGGSYMWALVEFADGTQQLSGCYPRAKEPEDLSPAVRSARYRRLMMASGGIYLNVAAAACPAVVSVRRLTDPEEIDAARSRWIRQSDALEAFHFAPHWDDGDTPRSMDWIRDSVGEWSSDVPEKWQAIARDHCARPKWWRVLYRGEGADNSSEDNPAPALPRVYEPGNHPHGIAFMRVRIEGTQVPEPRDEEREEEAPRGNVVAMRRARNFMNGTALSRVAS